MPDFKGYRFVSPGIQIKEIDRSQVTTARPERGPLVVGRFKQGPGMRPVTVTSYAEFVKIFGEPHAGGASTDAWRGDAHGGPTYGAYAVEAWLNAGVAPATVVRLLGEQNANATAAGKAGWETKNSSGTALTHVASGLTNAATYATNGGAYGLFIVPSGSGIPGAIAQGGNCPPNAAWSRIPSGSLAAVWYLVGGSIALQGRPPGGDRNTSIGSSQQGVSDKLHTTGPSTVTSNVALFSGSCGTVLSRADSGDNPNTFSVILTDANSKQVRKTFDFDRTSDRYIRTQFNTDPVRTNGNVYSSTDHYWLGETYEQHLEQTVNLMSGSAWLVHGRGCFTGSAAATASYSDATQDYYFNQAGGQLGIILGLGNSSGEWQQHRESFADAKTGWFFAQDTGDAESYNALDAQKLFRFHGLNHGEWLQNNMKISIENIKPAPGSKYKYGTFDVVLRRIDSPDNANSIVEVYSRCTLDPNAKDGSYIKQKIGDKYEEWDSVNERMRTYGSYDNRSSYIRVEMNSDVDDGSTAAELLPWGFFGPPRPKGFMLISRATDAIKAKLATPGVVGAGEPAAFATAFVEASGSIPEFMLSQADDVTAGNTFQAEGDVPMAGQIEVNLHASAHADGYTIRMGFDFPSLKLVKVADANAQDRHRHLGVDWCRSGQNTNDAERDVPQMNRIDESILDCVRRLPASLVGGEDDPYANDMEYSFIFTMDDVQLEDGAALATKKKVKAFWVSGSRQSTVGSEADSTTGDYATRPNWAQRSWTARNSAFGSNGLYKYGYDRFTSLFYGGFDGLDIQEMEPFRNTYLDDASNDRTINYGFNTVYRALQTAEDPEYVEYNILTMPGITEENLTKKAVAVCEERADALAVIDVTGGFVPRTESTDSESSRRGSITTIASNMESRELDSSYGAAYYPWCQVRDSRSGQRVWMPPSVIGVGTMGYSQANSEIWFAPAGFIRGGLTSTGTGPGAAGLKVLNVKERLTQEDRDDLYEQNVNPIAKFPSEGIVVFGQKTLQVTPSALDRINVRRLLLYVKKEISLIASTIIFQQNTQTTWDSFKSKADAFLSDVQARFGLTDYLVTLMSDDTPSTINTEGTVTDDLVDMNALHAEIYLKPAKAIEFIAIDFIITRAGASFAD